MATRPEAGPLLALASAALKDALRDLHAGLTTRLLGIT